MKRVNDIAGNIQNKAGKETVEMQEEKFNEFKRTSSGTMEHTNSAVNELSMRL